MPARINLFQLRVFSAFRDLRSMGKVGIAGKFANDVAVIHYIYLMNYLSCCSHVFDLRYTINKPIVSIF